jgi:hypothetical protein
MAYLYLPLDHATSVFFLSQSPTLQQQHVPTYIIQSTVTSISTKSNFSISVGIIILDLIILEFILWTINLKK